MSTYISEFPKSVIEQIGFYVYMLKHPLTGAIFYIGKGTGNRIFAHVNDALIEALSSDKLAIIRAIHAQHLQVEYEILRHGLTEKEAFEVESALIDFIGLQELSNKVAGQHAYYQGRMSVPEIIATYRAEAVKILEPALLVIINRRYYRNINAEHLYQITCGDWILGPRRMQATYAFAVYRGIIRAVYKINAWNPVETGNPRKLRWRFDGEIATNLSHYIGGNVESYFKKGEQSPTKYINC